MDLTSYVDRLRRELAVAAEAGGEDARALAERLTGPLDAADETPRVLARGSGEVGRRGRDPDFGVPPPLADDSFDDEATPAERGGLQNAPAPADAEDGGTSRITLRLPERIKPRIDEAAGKAGLSVNAWLVLVITAALSAGVPGQGANSGSGRGGRPGSGLGRRYTGWVR